MCLGGRAGQVGRWLHRDVGRRGAYLLFLSLLDFVIGYGLFQPAPLGLSQQVVYGPFLDIMPLNVWGWWWLGTGVLAAVAAVWHEARPYAFSAASLIKVAWAIGYLYGWIEGLPAFSRGYYSAAIFLAFAGLTLTVSGWQENRR